MKNELMAAPSDETLRECHALVFDSDLDAIRLKNVRAVITIGKLTNEQYLRIPGEFRRHYTGTKRVSFVLEQTEFARCLSDIPKNVTCYTIDDLYKQNEIIIKQGEVRNGYLKAIVEALASSGVGIRRGCGCGRRNVAGDETANKKLCDILKSRPECNSLTSEELGKLIGESGATVRKTPIWKTLSADKKERKERNEIIMRLNNDNLSQNERDKLKNRLENLDNGRKM